MTDLGTAPGPREPTSAREFSGPVRTALFCHAAGFTGLVLRACARRVRKPLRVFAPDLRGHGGAPPLPPGADWSVFADDVLASAAPLGPGPLIGVGHSLGGTALLLAEAAAPGTFDLLVCHEPILADPAGPVDDAFARSADRRRAVFPSKAAALARYSSRPPLSELHPEVLADYVDSGLTPDPGGGVRLCCAPQDEARVYRTAASCGWREALGRVRCPVVLLRGENSPVVSAESLASAASELRSGATRTISGMGHHGPLTHPAAFASALDEVFDSALFRPAPAPPGNTFRNPPTNDVGQVVDEY
ncbi:MULTISPECIES: alpha/beta fold hydrolase [Actinosynnema]|uniref:alpha/beta fold hydrolase n=1 Tax=Actinosynnema TaxID=40566 RepID=UPI0020A58997|nr:alpha/beta hydrolase [Actinosynnema pretiosum]MCP2096297.1 Pimeloyl-ACP methyl ester carboxylesterase [Actinosynnema pretiosum]